MAPDTGTDITRTVIIALIAVTYLGAGIMTFALFRVSRRANEAVRNLACEILAARKDAGQALKVIEGKIKGTGSQEEMGEEREDEIGNLEQLNRIRTQQRLKSL